MRVRCSVAFFIYVFRSIALLRMYCMCDGFPRINVSVCVYGMHIVRAYVLTICCIIFELLLDPSAPLLCTILVNLLFSELVLLSVVERWFRMCFYMVVCCVVI